MLILKKIVLTCEVKTIESHVRKGNQRLPLDFVGGTDGRNAGVYHAGKWRKKRVVQMKNHTNAFFRKSRKCIKNNTETNKKIRERTARMGKTNN